MAGKVIILSYIIKEDEGGFSAHCKELDVCSQGNTVEEAKENLNEAVGLYLSSIEELGIRKQVFKEKNIKILSKKPRTRNVPIEVLDNDNHDSYFTTRAVSCF